MEPTTEVVKITKASEAIVEEDGVNVGEIIGGEARFVYFAIGEHQPKLY